MSIQVTFKPSGRGKARCPPDPRYPNGIAINAATPDRRSCYVTLPYPAPECGFWVVNCEQCGLSMAVTAAGRPDDPISIIISCKERHL